MEELMNSSVHEQLMAEVETYTMPVAARELLERAQPLILCGITAAGKDTLAHELMNEGGYDLVVSHTTRSPREDHGVWERDGENYHFVTEAQILESIKAQQFIEVKQVHANVYGTSIAAFEVPLHQGKVPMLEIDVQGVEEFIDAVPNLHPIFLVPPSLSVWQDRLKSRGNMAPEQFQKRLRSAVAEITLVLQQPSFQILVNQDKTISAKQIHGGNIGRDHDAVSISEELLDDIKKLVSV